MSPRPTGAAHPNAKLTQEQADLIRTSREGVAATARRFGVSKATVSLIRHGKAWAPPAPQPMVVPSYDAGPASVRADVAPAPRASGFPSADPTDEDNT